MDDDRVRSSRALAIADARDQAIRAFAQAGIPKLICRQVLERLPPAGAAAETLGTVPIEKADLVAALGKKRSFARGGFETALRRAGDRISGTPYTGEGNGLLWRVRFHGPGSKHRCDAAANLIFFRIEAELVGTSTLHPPEPHVRYRPLSFRAGRIQAARFVPGERRVVYAAALHGGAQRLYECLPDGPDARQLRADACGLLAVAGDGRCAINLDPRIISFAQVGRLAQVSLIGGSCTQGRQDVLYADYGPEGLALVTTGVGADGQCRLEYPEGTVLAATAGWFSHPRVGRDGSSVAVIHHPLAGDASGAVAVVSRTGTVTELSSDWKQVLGLAWSPDGSEVWFTATAAGTASELHAVHATTKVARRLLAVPAQLTLHDVSPAGDLLCTTDDVRVRMVGKASPDSLEVDLSYLDWTHLRDLSSDGRTIVFDESGEGAGVTYRIYRRGFDASEPLSLGEGAACALSPDGRSVLTMTMESVPHHLSLLALSGSGERQALPADGISPHAAVVHPDGRRVIFSGSQEKEGRRLWVLDCNSLAARPLSPPGVLFRTTHLLTPDGRSVLGQTSKSDFLLYPLDPGEPRRLEGFCAGDYPLRWNPDGSLFVATIPNDPCDVYRLDLDRHERKLCFRLRPPDATGLVAINIVRLTADAGAYAYSYMQHSSRLFRVEGVR